MIINNKRNTLFVILAAFFVTNAIVAELISSKLIHIGPFTMIVGIIPWPIVFLSTDIINEFYGKAVVKKLSVITCFMIAYAFLILFLAINIKAADGSPAGDLEFSKVFGQSLWVIVGSISAFIISQILDAQLFWFIREKTGGKMVWLRSTGSTVISQLIDSYVVIFIGFYFPGTFTFEQCITIGFTGYVFKLIVAVVLTPMIYIGHGIVKNYLGEKESENIAHKSAEESLGHKVSD